MYMYTSSLHLYLLHQLMSLAHNYLVSLHHSVIQEKRTVCCHSEIHQRRPLPRCPDRLHRSSYLCVGVACAVVTVVDGDRGGEEVSLQLGQETIV